MEPGQTCGEPALCFPPRPLRAMETLPYPHLEKCSRSDPFLANSCFHLGLQPGSSVSSSKPSYIDAEGCHPDRANLPGTCPHPRHTPALTPLPSPPGTQEAQWMSDPQQVASPGDWPPDTAHAQNRK